MPYNVSMPAKQCIEDAIKHYEEHRYQEALEAFEQALQIDPTSVRALLGKGIVFAQLKEYEKAVESYEQASKLAPDTAKIYQHLAV